MKKLFVLMLMALMIVTTACGNDDDGKSKKQDFSKISVTAEAQDLVNQKGEVKTVVWVTNNSDKKFSGNIKVVSLDVDGSHLGFDGFYPENLEPGKKTYGITWLKVGNPPKFVTEVLGGEFK